MIAWRRFFAGYVPLACFIGILLFSTAFADSPPEGLAALAFDGMDDLVEIPSRPMLGTTFTEEAWILPSPKDDRFHGIVGYPSNKVFNRAPGLWIHNRTEVHAGFGDGKDWNAFSSPHDAIVLEVWNHVAATYDGSTYRIYANGQEVVKRHMNKIPVQQPVMRIGRVDYWFPGAIREVRLWNRCLSGDEIRRQMLKELSGREDGLVAYFRFNDGSGFEAKNSVPDGGNGTFSMDRNGSNHLRHLRRRFSKINPLTAA